MESTVYNKLRLIPQLFPGSNLEVDPPFVQCFQTDLFRFIFMRQSVWPVAVSKYAEKEGLRQCHSSDKHETSMRQQGDKLFHSSEGKRH